MTGPLNVLLGGAGLVGSALNRKLQAGGEETLVYDLKSGFDLREKVPAMPGREAYYWFLAWDVGGAKYIMDKSQQRTILQNNLRLCEKVFGWLHERNASYTFVSTQMVGFDNAYGVTKAVGETWAKLVGNAVITRLWNCYDLEAPSHRSHVIPDLIAQGKTGQIRLMTCGDERRQFLHAQDVADALIHQRDTGQAVADVTSGEWITILDVARIIGATMNATVEVGDQAGYESLVEPTQLLEGWTPNIDLRTGVKMIAKRLHEVVPE